MLYDVEHEELTRLVRLWREAADELVKMGFPDAPIVAIRLCADNLESVIKWIDGDYESDA